MAPILLVLLQKNNGASTQQIWIFIWHSHLAQQIFNKDTQFSQLLVMNNMTMEENSGIPWFSGPND